MDWWQEDPELLSATLTLLANSEDNQYTTETAMVPYPMVSILEAPSVEIETKLLKSTAIPTKPRPRVINATRERRRNEMQYLRSKVVDLETQLTRLQQRRREMLRPHRSETGAIRSVAAVWEEMARRQVIELKRSREINNTLKELANKQMVVAEDLFAAIRRAEAESNRHQPGPVDGILTIERPRLAIDISQRISEEDQLARLEKMCMEWQEAFASSRFCTGNVQFFDMQLVQDNGVEAIIDIVSCAAYPFPVDQVENILWRFILEEDAEDDDGVFAQECVSHNDTIVANFHATSSFDNQHTTFDGKYVAKRLRSPDNHMMLISHTYSEPQTKSNFLKDVAVEEDSWIRIIPAHDAGGPLLTHPLTLMQEKRRLRIQFGEGKVECAMETRQGGALTDFLMHQAEDQLKRGEQCIENMLFDDFGKLSVSTAPVEDGESRAIV